MKDQLVPELRFEEFEGEWELIYLRKLLKKRKERNSELKIREVFSVAKGPGIINQIEHLGKSMSSADISNYKIVAPNDLVYTKSPTAGFPFGIVKFNKTNRSGVVSVLYAVYKPVNKHVGFLLEKYFDSEVRTFNYLLPIVNKGAKNTMNVNNDEFLKSRKIIFPTLPEQQKIATFLSLVDRRLAAARRRVEVLEEWKRGVVISSFERSSEYPLTRFEEIFKRVKSKNDEYNENVLTISAQQGLVSQTDYFNKSVAAKNISGYYLLQRDDFAYNKSYSKGFPYGAIKRLTKYDKGVVSTLYICFRLKNTNATSIDYVEQLFNAGVLNREISKIAQEGARNHGLLNVSVVEFFRDIKIPLPPLAEQTRIATILTTIDARITAAQKEVAGWEEWKRGLLQKMLV